MKTGGEFDLVVKNSHKALETYEKIFDIKRIEVTDRPVGNNGAVFSIYDVRFHMLDENLEFQLKAPETGAQPSFWFNIAVPDIEKIHKKALEADCSEIQAVTEVHGFGVSNSMFSDSFGYVWMLHQIDEIVSFEDRMRIMEDLQGAE